MLKRNPVKKWKKSSAIIIASLTLIISSKVNAEGLDKIPVKGVDCLDIASYVNAVKNAKSQSGYLTKIEVEKGKHLPAYEVISITQFQKYLAMSKAERKIAQKKDYPLLPENIDVRTLDPVSLLFGDKIEQEYCNSIVLPKGFMGGEGWVISSYGPNFIEFKIQYTYKEKSDSNKGTNFVRIERKSANNYVLTRHQNQLELPKFNECGDEDGTQMINPEYTLTYETVLNQGNDVRVLSPEKQNKIDEQLLQSANAILMKSQTWGMGMGMGMYGANKSKEKKECANDKNVRRKLLGGTGGGSGDGNTTRIDTSY